MVADIHLDKDEIRYAVEGGNPAAVAAAGTSLKKTWDKAVTVAGDVEKFGKAGKTALEVGEFFIKLLS